ncbi:MAG: hypothetical protein RRB13_07060 [bacterium]|nr:hypothetical protein [bacterium]
MKILQTVVFASLIVGLSTTAYAQDRLNNNGSDVLIGDEVENSLFSPKKIETFQNQDRTAKQKDARTLKSMYGNVNLIDLRSFDAGFIASSGFTGEKNNFETISGYNFGVTWEFPVLMKALEGGTPILKARAGKTEITSASSVDSTIVDSSLKSFVDTLGVSQLYTVAVGGGYCYHVGFDCVYAMYNTYLTGQLSTVNSDGSVSTVPTQLTGISFGTSSTFDVSLGIELTIGMEYSMLTHATPVSSDQNINALSINFGLGAVSQPRYVNMRPIEYVQ